MSRIPVLRLLISMCLMVTLSYLNAAMAAEYCNGFIVQPSQGWQYCEIDFNADSDVFTVPEGQGGCFRVTDYFVPGDVFEVINENGDTAEGGFFVGEALPQPDGDQWGNSGWYSADYFSAQIGVFDKGDTITNIVVENVGIPSGYYVRFDPGPVCGDSDSDGVLDSLDQCPDTLSEEIVNGEGCSIADLCPCEVVSPRDGINHGNYVSCVAEVAGEFIQQGLITGPKGDWVSEAAQEKSCGM